MALRTPTLYGTDACLTHGRLLGESDALEEGVKVRVLLE